MLSFCNIYKNKKKDIQEEENEIDRAEHNYRRQAKKGCGGDLWEFPIDHLLLNVYGGNSKRLQDSGSKSNGNVNWMDEWMDGLDGLDKKKLEDCKIKIPTLRELYIY